MAVGIAHNQSLAHAECAGPIVAPVGHARAIDTASPALIAKLMDVASGAPLFAMYLFLFAKLLPGFRSELGALAQTGDANLALRITEQVVTIAFGGLQMVLVVIRRLPRLKAPGIAARAIALLSANLGFAFVLLPRVPQPPLLLGVTTSVAVLGLGVSICCTAKLGRAFSILPQARGFVSDGPYRFVRHPLYLGEQVTTFGICFQFLQPWSLLIAFASLALQIVRMACEERVLAAAFPEYRVYASRTARLIPGIY